MTSVLVVVGIEMFFATRGAGHMHGSEYDQVPEDQALPFNNGHTVTKMNVKLKKPRRGSFQGGEEESESLQPNGQAEQEAWSEVPAHSPRFKDDDDDGLSRNSSDLDLDELDPTTSVAPIVRGLHSRSHSQRSNSYRNYAQHEIPTDPVAAQALERKLLLQCLLLEAGILFHSVFIGIAVSVSVGPPFVVLLVAISFHQTFEGFALGSRIAAIPTLAPSSPKPWLMALAYGTTTPIGQAIGLAVHRLYDPQSQTGLLMVGTMNAISSGLLLFAGLVELLAEDFLSDNSYTSLTGRRRKEACGAVVGGAFLMALVGAWA